MSIGEKREVMGKVWIDDKPGQGQARPVPYTMHDYQGRGKPSPYPIRGGGLVRIGYGLGLPLPW